MAEANITSLPAAHIFLSIAFNRNVFLSICGLAIFVFYRFFLRLTILSCSVSPRSLGWDNLILRFHVLKYRSPVRGKDDIWLYP